MAAGTVKRCAFASPFCRALCFFRSSKLKDFEKLLIWFIPLFLIEYVITSGASWFFVETVKVAGSKPSKVADFYHFTGFDPSTSVAWLSAIHPWLALATKILVAIWLFISAKKVGSKSILWAVFGGAVGVNAIAIYYLILIYEQQQNYAKAKT